MPLLILGALVAIGGGILLLWPSSARASVAENFKFPSLIPSLPELFPVQLKDDSVNLEGVSWRMFRAAAIADSVYKKHGAEAVVTSAKDGEHSQHSLHYEGLAIDLRTRNVPDPEAVRAELQEELGPDYAVIFEGDHIHVQYSWDNVIGGSPYA